MKFGANVLLTADLLHLCMPGDLQQKGKGEQQSRDGGLTLLCFVTISIIGRPMGDYRHTAKNTNTVGQHANSGRKRVVGSAEEIRHR